MEESVKHQRLVRSRTAIVLAAVYILCGACKARNRPVEEANVRFVAALTTPALQALYKNGDAAAPNDNQLKPFFKIKNTGSASIPLSTVTLRYWYTIESGSPEQVWVDFAQMGNGNVSGRVVRLPAPRTGADRYLEVSFSSAAGSLGAGVTSGEVQMRINKTDWTVYNETDDYSYQNVTSFVTASKVTAYWNGMLVWGTEPAPVPDCDSGVRLRVLYVAGDRTLPSDNQVKPRLQVVNTGFADIPLKEVKVRYWFTKDSSSAEQAWVDYAQIGASKVTQAFASPPSAVATADRYLEVGFSSTAGTLLAGASTGEIQLRFNKTDWSNYSEANDASYDGTRTDYQPSMQVTAYRNGRLLWGEEPTPGAPIPGQNISVEASRIKQANGSFTSAPGSQTFTSPVPITLPQVLPVAAGNLGNQSVRLDLTTTGGTISCTYKGAAPAISPTTDIDVAKGQMAVFNGCGQTCPFAGDIVFVTGVSLTVLGSDPTQTRTTVTCGIPSGNDPISVVVPIADTDPLFPTTRDVSLPPESPLGTEGQLNGPPQPRPPQVTPQDLTTDPLQAGYVDTVDPTIIIEQQ